MNRLNVLLGALNYEFRMQIRRRSVWITFISLGLLLTQFHIWNRPLTTLAEQAIIYWTGVVQTILAIAVGILLADRLPRDQRLKLEFIVLQLKDTGEGIPAEDLPHIWERFYQTESTRTRLDGGTGLGLALVKEWIEVMGGAVEARSIVGEGSCFTIRLPGMCAV